MPEAELLEIPILRTQGAESKRCPQGGKERKYCSVKRAIRSTCWLAMCSLPLSRRCAQADSLRQDVDAARAAEAVVERQRQEQARIAADAHGTARLVFCPALHVVVGDGRGAA